jgi:hypothetical protein
MERPGRRLAEPPPNEPLASLLSGLEARLSNQLSSDREALAARITGGAAAGYGGGGGGGAPIVLIPDEPLERPCGTCGRIFEPLRMAVHTRSCARLQQPPPPAAFAAQQRADNVRKQAWVHLTGLQQRQHHQQSQHQQANNHPMPTPTQQQQQQEEQRRAAAPATALPTGAPQRRPSGAPSSGVRTPGGARTPVGRASAAAAAAHPPPPPIAVPRDGSPQSDQGESSSEARRVYDSTPAQSAPPSEAGWAEEAHPCDDDDEYGEYSDGAPVPIDDQYYEEPAPQHVGQQEEDFERSISMDRRPSTAPSQSVSEAPSEYPSELPEDGEAPDLVPCEVCGRNFAADRLEKHMKICSKASTKKRKAFGPSLERMKQQEKEAKEKEKEREAKEKKKAVWKQQHEAFQAALKTAAAHSAGEPPPADLPEVEDTRTPCPHCGRKFDSLVAERHIPSCAKAIKRPNAVGAARSRGKASPAGGESDGAPARNAATPSKGRPPSAPPGKALQPRAKAAAAGAASPSKLEQRKGSAAGGARRPSPVRPAGSATPPRAR